MKSKMEAFFERVGEYNVGIKKIATPV